MVNDRAEPVPAPWETVEDTRASKLTFFDANTTTPYLPGREAYDDVVIPEKVRDKIDLAELRMGRMSLKVLLNQSTDNGFSLVQVTIAPHTVIARHKHPVDQVVWCVAGSMTHGNRLLEPGSGYFTPADHAYAFETGPDGVTYLEFRDCPLEKAKTVYVEDNLARWGLTTNPNSDDE